MNKKNYIKVNTRHAVSEQRNARIQKKENTDIIEWMLHAMNAWHTLDSMYFPNDSDREKIRKQLKEEIDLNKKKLSADMENRISNAMKNKRYWEELRERLW